jgi:hypothetical protein
MSKETCPRCKTKHVAAPFWGATEDFRICENGHQWSVQNGAELSDEWLLHNTGIAKAELMKDLMEKQAFGEIV